MLSQLKWNPCSEPCSDKIHRERMDHGKQVTENRFDYFLILRPSLALMRPESMPSTWIVFARFEGGKRVFFKIINHEPIHRIRENILAAEGGFYESILRP